VPKWLPAEPMPPSQLDGPWVSTVIHAADDVVWPTGAVHTSKADAAAHSVHTATQWNAQDYVRVRPVATRMRAATGSAAVAILQGLLGVAVGVRWLICRARHPGEQSGPVRLGGALEWRCFGCGRIWSQRPPEAE
jgi:hypothetical protein